MSVTLIVEVFVNIEREQDFLALALAHAACSRLEPGCLEFEVLRAAEKPIVPLFTLHEVWDSYTALQEHRTSKHYERWRREIADMEAAPRRRREYLPVESKLLDAGALECLGTAARHAGKAVVWTNGCFDGGLHPGHMDMLREARDQGDLLIVGLNSDESVRELKGPSRPIISQDRRAEMLSALPWVNHVVLFHDRDLLRLIGELRPAVLAKGGQYAGQRIVGAEFANRLHLTRHVEGISTTEIVRKMAASA
jgi:rfaE bifunctional protein nucleotidyltransferase chain/domain